MKNQLKYLALVLLFMSFSLSAQVRVEGGVSIDISVPPVPEVIIVNPGPNTPRPNPRDRRIEIPRDDRSNRGGGNRNNRGFNSRYGEIRNQNGPNGLQDLPVRNAQLQTLRDGLENVVYYLASGDVLELVIATSNPNDYNYHFNNQRWQSNNNRIVKVLLNNRYLDLRDGSLSLQPRGQRGFHSVINLHSVYEGDFNGTVNF